MSRSSRANCPRSAAACPELAGRRRSAAPCEAGGSWQETTDSRASRRSGGRLPGPGPPAPRKRAGRAHPSSGYQNAPGARRAGRLVSPSSSMVWLPGQQTPIHDHLTWCCTAVLQGTEYEVVYALRGDHLEVVRRNANPVATVSGFAPPGDIHRVTNVGDAVAVSMHVYGTDITRVGSSVRRVYDLPGPLALPRPRRHRSADRCAPVLRPGPGYQAAPRLARPAPHSDNSKNMATRHHDGPLCTPECTQRSIIIRTAPAPPSAR